MVDASTALPTADAKHERITHLAFNQDKGYFITIPKDKNYNHKIIKKVVSLAQQKLASSFIIQIHFKKHFQDVDQTYTFFYFDFFYIFSTNN